MREREATAVPFQLAAVLLTLRGELGLAADAAQQTMLLRPHDAEVAAQLGAAASRAGREEAAEMAYGEAVRLDPRSSDGWAGLGRSHAARGVPHPWAPGMCT